MPTTTSRLSLQQPLGGDPVSEYRVATSNNAGTLDAATLVLTGTAASRPAAATIGRFYLATDTGALSFDTGSKWVTLSAGIDTTVASAARNTNFTVNGGTTGRISLNQILFDPGNNFDITTNFCYVAPTAGYYQVSGWVNFATNFSYLQAFIFQNGAETLIGDSTNNGLATVVVGIVQCAAADKIDLRVLNGNVSAQTVNSATLSVAKVA